MQTQVTTLRWLSDFTQLSLGTQKVLYYYLKNAGAQQNASGVSLLTSIKAALSKVSQWHEEKPLKYFKESCHHSEIINHVKSNQLQTGHSDPNAC